MSRFYERLGSCILPRELEDLGLEDTLQYDPYEGEAHNEQTFPQLVEELELMPEVGDLYIGADILLPRGDQMARGHIVARSKDANRNVMGRSHTNSILVTRMYHVEFTGGRSYRINAQCNSEGNEYLLLDALVDYQKDNKAIFPYQTNRSQYGLKQ